MGMKIFIGADHAGYELKKGLILFLEALGHDVTDKGAYIQNEDDDYPDYIFPVAEEVSMDPAAKGIVIGGSGQGEAIAANRVKGVRAAVFYGSAGSAELEIIKLSRKHNDANVLSLGARFLSEEEARTAVRIWLETLFSGDERHIRRIKKIDGTVA